MTVAVLSDIHSNYHAFEACFEDAIRHHAEQFIFLGDYVSDLAEPEKTMDLVYEIRVNYPTVCLRGNREGYMLACQEGSASFVQGSKSGSLLFTYEHLRAQDITFFRELKVSDSIELGGVQMEIAHAAANDDRYYFDIDNGRMADIFTQMKAKYLLTGHSHRQYIQSAYGKTIINPGSVGIPQGGSRWPQYAILEIEDGEVTCIFREVPYRMEDAIHAQFANGLVSYAKYWAIGVLYDIITGEEWVLKLLRLAQETGDIRVEETWRLTAIQLGMKLTEQEIKELVYVSDL